MPAQREPRRSSARSASGPRPRSTRTTSRPRSPSRRTAVGPARPSATGLTTPSHASRDRSVLARLAVMSTEQRLALVTGATGYIGGRLVPELLAAGFRVRCLARAPAQAARPPVVRPGRGGRGRRAAPRDALTGRLDGVDVAYYLVHSLGSGAAVRAHGTGTTAPDVRAAPPGPPGVGRIVYLGGLVTPGTRTSRAHLRLPARGRRDPPAPPACRSTVLRAAMIIGSGSASFEMLRYLTERLPVMITPRWVATRDPADRHPGRAALPGRGARPAGRASAAVFDIGGPDVADLPRDDAAATPSSPACRAPDRAAAGADAVAVEPLGRAS